MLKWSQHHYTALHGHDTPYQRSIHQPITLRTQVR